MGSLHPDDADDLLTAYKNHPKMVQVSTNPAAAMRDADGGKEVTPTEGGALPYRAFFRRHGSYDARYWRKLRAFYRGGKELLNPTMVCQVLARNNKEADHVYEWRCAQAFYLNYGSEIIDNIVSGLSGDPVRILKDGKVVDEDDPLAKWASDVGPPDAELETPLAQFVKDMVIEAMQTRFAWVLLDRPPIDLPSEASRADAEKAGATRVCARVIPAEDVLHWEIDTATKRLMWGLIGTVDLVHSDFYGVPEVVETYTRYTDKTFTQWQVRYKPGDPPKPDDMVPPMEGRIDVEHGFTRIPLRRFELPAGLWAMDKMESALRAIFNKWNLLDLAERRSLLPVLYEFLGPESMGGGAPAAAVAAAQRDAMRAVRTPRSPNHVQVRGRDDKAEFVGPSPEPFKQARETLVKLCEEVHRILYQMALSTNASAAAVGRSADSKREDKGVNAIIQKAIGRLVVAFIKSILPDVGHVAAGMSAEDARTYSADGLEKFDDVIESELVEQTATLLTTLNIPSATAVRELLMRLLRRVLAHLNPDELATISKEIEANITPEALLASPGAQQAIMEAVQAAIDGEVAKTVGGKPVEDDEDDEDDDRDPDAADRKPGPAPKPRPTGPMVDTAAKKRRRA